MTYRQAARLLNTQRNAKLSPQQRKEIAQKAARARWAKQAAK